MNKIDSNSKQNSTQNSNLPEEIHRNAGLVDEAIVNGLYVAPSNNRGEMLAAIMGLNHIINNPQLRDAHVKVCTDSQYLCTCADKDRMQARVFRGEFLGARRPVLNPDLVGMLHLVLRMFPERDPVFEHVRAAHDRARPPVGIDRFKWDGNHAADRLAVAQFGTKLDSDPVGLSPAGQAALTRAQPKHR